MSGIVSKNASESRTLVTDHEFKSADREDKVRNCKEFCLGRLRA